MANSEHRKRFITFAIIYTCICAAVISVAVFFQYRAYTKNYNLAAARICALVQEKYPDVTGSSIAEILNDNVSEKYDDNGKEFMQKYGIDMESDSVIMENDKEMKRFITIDIVAVVFMSAGFLGYIFSQRRYYENQISQMTACLRRINEGSYMLKMDDSKEGAVSILKSELYKTAVMMREAAENAKADKIMLKDSLSDISHQLKTPLTSLSINLENLEDNPDMDEASKNRILRRAKHDVVNISHMVLAILKLSRLEADVVEFNEKETKLSDITESAADRVTALCDLKDISLKIKKDSDRNAVVYCDSYWQTEAVTNIVKNAVEHAAKNVAIGYYSYEMYDEIVVENDGRAISDEDKKNIFKRFYRGQDFAADSVGIGLSLAESIIRHDNGYVMVDDLFNEKKECEGTRFVVRYLR